MIGSGNWIRITYARKELKHLLGQARKTQTATGCSRPRFESTSREIKKDLSKDKSFFMAPGTGFEPATHWLTANCSTAELSRIINI
jgi:hypothetical protein